MLTTRKRPTLSAIGMATAVTVSLSLLSGCNGARFLMGGDPTQPTTGTNVQGQTPGATATPMQLTTFTLKGHADYFGAPVANAKVTLFDAISGEPARVIAAGGGNYAITNNTRSFVQVAASSFSTDANGDFEITYQAPANSKGQGLPVRVLVTGVPAANYQVQQTAGSGSTGGFTAVAPPPPLAPGAGATATGGAAGSTSIGGLSTGVIVAGVVAIAAIAGIAAAVASSNNATTTVSAATTVAAQNSFGVLSIMKSLKTDAAVDVSYGYLVELGKLTKAIEEKITKADFETFAKSLDSTGKMTDDKALRSWLSDKGIATAMDATATAGMKSAAEKFADKNNVVQKIDVSGDDFVGSNFNIQIQNGQLVVVNSVTGEATSFNLDAGNTGGVDNGSTDTPATTQDGVTEDDTNLVGNPDVAPVVSSGSFNPGVTLSKGGSSLTVDVTQPQGSDDIAAIFARVPNAALSGTFIGSSLLSAVGGTSMTTLTSGTSYGLTLQQDNSLAFTAQAGPRFANVSLSNPKWQGWLKTTGGVNVAKFGVFDNGGYYYLVTRFALNNAVTTSVGHHTVLVTNDAALSSTAKAEISIVSRRGAIVERTN